MNHDEFLELLNLHLDHEITPADAARLEAEIQANPARRALYRQYRQMNQACAILAARAGASAPAADANLIAFPPQRRVSPATLWLGAGGVLATAACLVLAFGYRARMTNDQPAQSPMARATSPVGDTATAVVIAPAASTERRTMARTVSLTPHPLDLQPALPSNGLKIEGATTAFASAPAQLDWIQNVKLSPLSATPVAAEINFDLRPIQTAQPALYPGRQPLPDATPMSAFKFQRD
ncbi:MAG: hypothetical protein RLZZ15_2546 [Verrucomicrobiota bacterium]|jgi:hypothetical protein